MALRASLAREVEDIPVAPCGVSFPSPALSLGERVNLLATEYSPDLSALGARCSLSLGERVRVRGNGANDPLPYRTIRGTVELDESSGEAKGFQE